MANKRRIFGFRIPDNFTINVAWILGVLLVIWVVWAFYTAFMSATEISRVNREFTRVLEGKRVQEWVKEDISARASIVVGAPAATPEPGVTATREVLTPSRKALLKEEIRYRRLVKPGERIISLPGVERGVPLSEDVSITPGYTPRTPLEAWKSLLGLSRPGQR